MALPEAERGTVASKRGLAPSCQLSSRSAIQRRNASAGDRCGWCSNEDGQPVAHAATCISALGSHKTKCNGFTDQGGQFEIQHLSTGTFLVFATKEEDGYSRLMNQSTGQKVVLTPQEPSANITVKLAPKGGTLIGSARDSLTGKLVEFVHVAYIATDGH